MTVAIRESPRHSAVEWSELVRTFRMSRVGMTSITVAGVEVLALP